jgi:hypothetical protein
MQFVVIKWETYSLTQDPFSLGIIGIADGISVVIRQTILQLRTPDEMRGRVSSMNSMFVGSSNDTGAFESGVTARLMGRCPQ